MDVAPRDPAKYDAVVVGAGPNGLAAAIVLARAGCEVLVVEAAESVGGGTRSAALTLPGFVHDVCSAIHPLGAGSPLFQTFPLDRFGLEWIQPPVPLAHPLDDGTAVLLERTVEATAAGLGPDASAYRRLMAPLVADADRILRFILGPFRIPRHPLALARFGLKALRSVVGLASEQFEGERARALLAGLAAHSMLPLERSPSAAVGLVLAMLGHTAGWPLPRGGSQRIADTLAAYVRSLGGEIVTGRPVRALDELPPCRAVLLDLTPRQVLAIAGQRFPAGYRRWLERYRYGPGVYKMDWALAGPIPWRAPECQRAATVHLGGTLDEIAAAERAVTAGRHPERPFVILAQPSLFDPSRAPAGRHTAWAYCHVPNSSRVDMTERIEAQVERFAPGFRDLILARSVSRPADLEQYNLNYVGGDINGGLQDLRQLFTRPAPRLNPYTTPDPRLYICSASTPPGGGVHGMCGYWAARAALRRVLRVPRRRA
ncbi:NAD(P)/FAD-dependent oxidoreductase [Thermomicrobiaceae bacterium CFH 74404]|uniref:NAD(P)/FAD-dependent oxidoreductase n=1 Tax=Thermalbibacter longus TaxID=2951981 RepID=A0AA42B9E3_9BACT|nr:NAD(P)/FAD-dependent oxidoreductase [Thermalbibacter longus]MCM8748426.1 NAD(P)/FAD-dependent oxidoreductase [Thermalbibacter longus]